MQAKKYKSKKAIMKNLSLNVKVILLLILITSSQLLSSQGNWVIKGEKTQLRGDQIIQISEDKSGSIWTISTPKSKEDVYFGHLNRYNINNEWEDFKGDQDIYNKKFSILHSYQNLDMYCYGYDDGQVITYKYDGAIWENMTLEHERIKKEYSIPKKEKLRPILRDSLNRIWAESEKGILLCEGNSYKRFFEKTNFAQSAYKTIFPNTFHVDKFAITDHGIYSYHDEKFTKCREVSKNEYFFYLGEDYRNRSWFIKVVKGGFGTKNYFTYYDGDSWKDFDQMVGSYPSIPSVSFHPDGSLWYIIKHTIAYIKNDIITKLPVDEEEIPPYFQFDKMVFDTNNNVFISCNIDIEALTTTFRWEKHGGFLIHFDGTKFIYYKDEDKLERLRKTYIRDMIVDSRNNLWIITGFPKKDLYAGEKSSMILKKSGDEIEIFDKSNGFDVRFYTVIFEDSKGRIWVGSSNEGIFMYEYEAD